MVLTHTYTHENNGTRVVFSVSWDTGGEPELDPDGYPNMQPTMLLVGDVTAVVEGPGTASVTLYRGNSVTPWRTETLTAGAYAFPTGGPVRRVRDLGGSDVAVT